MPFSSFDRDHATEGCAKFLGAGWWLIDCEDPGLNGLYPSYERQMDSSYMSWLSSDGSRLNVTKTSMKIRRF